MIFQKAAVLKIRWRTNFEDGDGLLQLSVLKDNLNLDSAYDLGTSNKLCSTGEIFAVHVNSVYMFTTRTSGARLAGPLTVNMPLITGEIPHFNTSQMLNSPLFPGGRGWGFN